MFVDPSDPSRYRASLFNSVVAPRPIGWISSIDAEGRANLAPFSYFNGISATPPMVMFACNAPADRPEKDTLANVRATGQFVANLATFALREQMNATSATVAAGIDEFELVGLEKAASRLVAPPRVAASPVSLECRVVRIVDVEPEGPDERRSSIVIGRVVGLHVADDHLDANGRFDVTKARPLARLGGFSYLAVEQRFELPRPAGASAAG